MKQMAKTLYEVFKEHMDKNGFGEWLNQRLTERFAETKSIDGKPDEIDGSGKRNQ